MPFARKQKFQASRSREMELLSDFDNMGVVLDDENSNHNEQELANTINCLAGQNDTEISSAKKENSSQENEMRDFNSGNDIDRRDKLMESMEIFSNEMNMRLSQEMDSLMSMMHSQLNRAMSSAINDRVIPGIRNIMGSLSLGHRDTESGTSGDNQESSEETNGLKTKLTNKDSRSAFDLRDTEDLSTYISHIES